MPIVQNAMDKAAHERRCPDAPKEILTPTPRHALTCKLMPTSVGSQGHETTGCKS